MLKTFAVAVFETGTDPVVSLHIVVAKHWRDALDRSPAVWWKTPQELNYEAAQEFALKNHRCQVAVKLTSEVTVSVQ